MARLDPKEVEFRKVTRRALRDWEDYKEEQLRQVRAALKVYRNEVVAEIAPVTEWQKYQYDRVLKALNETSRQIGYQISGKWTAIANETTALALAGVDGPLAVLGLPTKMLPGTLPVQKLAVLNSYIPSLIVDATDEAQRKVAALMRQALLGGVNQQEILKKVGDVVGPLRPDATRGPDTIFSATERRVSTIMRTEMNGIHNLVKTTRRDELAGKYPGVGTQWIHRDSPHPRANHAALDGKIIFPAKGEKFDVGGYQVDGPHALELPAGEKINCHCTTITVYQPDQDARQAAAESPYIPGDGSDIPSAGLPRSAR